MPARVCDRWLYSDAVVVCERAIDAKQKNKQAPKKTKLHDLGGVAVCDFHALNIAKREF